MAKKRPDSFHIAKRKAALERLVERYYGKLALLEAWEDKPNGDRDYINDLKRRVRGHKNDLTYRGRGVEEELAENDIRD